MSTYIKGWVEFFRGECKRPVIFVLKTVMFLSLGAILGAIIAGGHHG